MAALTCGDVKKRARFSNCKILPSRRPSSFRARTVLIALRMPRKIGCRRRQVSERRAFFDVDARLIPFMEVNPLPNIMASKVFDYRLLRLIAGMVAFSLPLIVDMVASTELPSISGSYYTGARDLFVGLLFVEAALFLSYRGHNARENRGANIASLAAVCVALFPTAPVSGGGGWGTTVHYTAAIVLFSILAWFCFGPFRERTRGRDGMKGRRARIYLVCGWIIVGAMAALLAAKQLLPAVVVADLELTYWAEFIALWAFGAAWITAGKVLPFLVSPEEALHTFALPASQASS